MWRGSKILSEEEFKYLVDSETQRACREVALKSPQEVEDELLPFCSGDFRAMWPGGYGITEMRIFLSSLIATARVEKIFGRKVW